MSLLDPVTTGERYSIATTSSDLRVTSDRHCDADLLIAAAWQDMEAKRGACLGTTLLRAVNEFERSRIRQRHGAVMNQTELALTLDQMSGLVAIRQEVGRYAEWLATTTAFMGNPQLVAVLAGQVLTAFLCPSCPHCDGRGFNGGGRFEMSGPQIICRKCKGSGQTRANIGRTHEEISFASTLLMDMGSQMRNVESGIRHQRDHVKAAKEAIDHLLRECV